MRIAVMGAGAVGCFLGGKLAVAGEDVVFVARGERLQALRAEGLRIVEGGAETLVRQIEAVESAEEVGAVDAVLLCVKLFDLQAAIASLGPLLGPETFVVTTQNGVEAAANVSEAVGEERVVGGAVWVVASMTAPAVVECTGDWAGIEIAEMSGEHTARCETFAAACSCAGIDCIVHEDLERMLWSKFVLLSATSATTALTRQPIGYVRGDPIALQTARACIRETMAVAAARGVGLPENLESTAMLQLCEEMAADAKASQLVDLEHGRPLELEHLSGAIHRMGLAAGVPTPVHSTVYAALRPFMHGNARNVKLRAETR